jgi:ethanolamine-phosphate cytidylyltransferase
MTGQIIAADSPWFLSALAVLHYVLQALGVPPERHLAAIVTAFLLLAMSILASRLWRNGIERVVVAVEPSSSRRTPPPEPPQEVRIFMDGAFDMMHFGHMNAFRLARSLGTQLIVGINSDESIVKCKGPPLMNDEQRLTMVKSCKFVDQVVPNCPYIMNKEYLDYIIDEFKIDYVIHGDDPCIVDGKDVYATAKAAGKYQSIPRTEGVSTTDLVGRILLLNNYRNTLNGSHSNGSHSNGSSNGSSAPPAVLGQMSRFLTSSMLLNKFSAGNEDPKPGMRVVYIDGAFDTFHCGHIAMLQAARKVSYMRSSAC